MHKVTLLPGDGVGPEIAEATRKCVEATGVKIEWDVQECGIEVIEAKGGVPASVLESIRANKVALKAPITTPIGKGFRSVNVYLRQELGLYACVRPCKTYKGVRTFFDACNVDLVIVRENTEDLYAGVEFKAGEAATRATDRPDQCRMPPARRFRPDWKTTGISIKPMSIEGTTRIADYAFKYAVEEQTQIGDVDFQSQHHEVHRRPVVRRDAGGRECVPGEARMGGSREECASDRRLRTPANWTPGSITYMERLIDNMCMQLVQKPEQYDVLVMGNLYGDILSDLCAGLVGGLGVAPGANIGVDGAIFEATHGSAPKYKGQNKVNPTALILSAQADAGASG